MKTLINRLLLLAKDRWFVLIVIILLSGLLLIGKCNNNKLADKNQIQAVELSALNDSVKTVVSKNGDLTFELTSIQVESDNRRKALEESNFMIKDLRQRDIAWRNTVFALKAQIVAQGSGTTVLRDTIWKNSVDTIHASVFAWNNKFLFLNGNIIEKKLSLSYRYEVGLSLVSTKAGKGTTVSAYLTDPNAHIFTANSITIVPVKRWWDKWYVYGAAGLIGGYFVAK